MENKEQGWLYDFGSGDRKILGLDSSRISFYAPPSTVVDPTLIVQYDSFKNVLFEQVEKLKDEQSR